VKIGSTIRRTDDDHTPVYIILFFEYPDLQFSVGFAVNLFFGREAKRATQLVGSAARPSRR
jgi:hypothetical protein